MLNDLRFAWRLLRKDVLFTVMAVATLALGIGGTSSVFSALHAAIVRPLPYPNPEQLVMVWSTQPFVNPSPLSAPDYADYRDKTQSFALMSPMDFMHGYNLSTGEAQVRVDAAGVSADYFKMLETKPVLGRTFLPAEETLGAEKVVILSAKLWREHFGADPEIIDRSVSLDGEPCRVVGVVDLQMRPHVRSVADVWVPFRYDAKTMDNRRSHWLFAMARLKPGVSFQAAESDLVAVAAANRKEHVEDENVGARLVPLRDQLYGQKAGLFFLLLGGAALLLLIACVNVANLLLSRSRKRQAEITIRLAVGATPGRIVRQLLTESLLLSLLGAGFGLLVSLWGIDALNANEFLYLAQAGGARLDATVVLATLLVAAVTSVLFGLAPAFSASRIDLQSGLRRGQGRLGRGLIVAQLALALVLLSAAGFTTISFERIRNIDPGFEPKGLLTFLIALPEDEYRQDDPKTIGLYQSLKAKLARIPGVESVGIINALPLGRNNMNGNFDIIGREPWPKGEAPLVEFLTADAGYFAAAKVGLLKGRIFNAGDERKDAGVCIINETMAKRYWPNGDAIGARFKGWEEGKTIEIIGIVEDTKRWQLEEEPRNEMYSSIFEWTPKTVSYLLRTAVPPMTLAEQAARLVGEEDATLAAFDVQSGEAHVAKGLQEHALIARVLGLYAFLATLLAAIGVYGVVSHQVEQRTREIAIRIALGAEATRIRSLLLKETLLTVALASGFGLLAVFFVHRGMQAMVYGASWRDLLIGPLVCAFLALIALAATLVPAHRASSVDPNRMLRYE